MRRLAPVACALLLASCALPQAAADRSQFVQRAQGAGMLILPLDRAAVEASQARRTADLSAFLATPAPSHDVLGQGDVIEIAVAETASASFSRLLEAPVLWRGLTVSADGVVAVPYAGYLNVGGMTVEEVRRAVRQRLERRIYQPQVEIRFESRPTHAVTVFGSVSNPGRHTLGRDLQTLGDLIGKAGLASERLDRVWIRLRREAREVEITVQDLTDNPAADVVLLPGDVVTVSERLEQVTVLGSVGVQNAVEITGRSFSLLDALSSARGLDRNSADPSGVFLFSRGRDRGRGMTVYSLDLRDPAQVALAQEFRLAPGDVVYVSTTSFAQAERALGMIARSVAPAASLTSVP